MASPLQDLRLHGPRRADRLQATKAAYPSLESYVTKSREYIVLGNEERFKRQEMQTETEMKREVKGN